MFWGWIWTQLRNSDAPPVRVSVKTHDGVPPRVNAVYIVEKDIEFHRLFPFDGTSNVVNKENYKARAASMRVVSTLQGRAIVLLLILIHVRDERVSKVRFREKLTPERYAGPFGIVSSILRYI